MKSQKTLLHQLLDRADLDFEFPYKVRNKPFENACRVRLFKNQPQVILLTELKDRGMSVTNSVEFIIPQLEQFLLIKKSILVKSDCIYIEHYDRDSWHAPENNSESFDRVVLLENRPGWSRLSKNEVLLLLTKN